MFCTYDYEKDALMVQNENNFSLLYVIFFTLKSIKMLTPYAECGIMLPIYT